MSNNEIIIVRETPPGVERQVEEIIIERGAGTGPAGTADISALKSKPTIVATDLALVGDSGSSFVGKKSTWQQVIDSVLSVFLLKSSLASQAQAEAGTDNTAWMSPLRVWQAITEFVVGTYLLATGGTLTAYKEATNIVTAGATETIPSTHNVHWYTLTEACLVTAPALPADVSESISHVVRFQSETFATSYSPTPEIRWVGGSPPTFDVTPGTLSTITLTLASDGTDIFWEGRDGGETA